METPTQFGVTEASRMTQLNVGSLGFKEIDIEEGAEDLLQMGNQFDINGWLQNMEELMVVSTNEGNDLLGRMEYVSPPNIEMDIREWLQEEEEIRSKRNIDNGPLPKNEDKWVKNRGRGKTDI